jgi:hypothetical protein
MRTWEITNPAQTIYGIAPLEEYLAALQIAARSEGEDRRLLLMVGDHGTGKTVGARVFQQDNDLRPIYLSLPPGKLLRARSLLNLIADPLGLACDLQSGYSFGCWIAESSHRRPRLFLLDDAEALANQGLLDVIRWLHDAGAHTFVLIGSPALEHAFRARAELAGRVAFRHLLRLPTPAEIAPLFDGVPQETIAQIYTETRGRMRQMMALRQWLGELIEQGRVEACELAPRQVQTAARHLLVRAA